jgi:serine/threonine-protein kinase
MTSIAEQVGRVVGGRYRLLAPVGTGASSQVYAASDTRLARRVAVKVLHPMLAGDQAFLRRFRAEARLAASLDHPHVMRVFDWGEEGEGPYLVLEYLGGGSLRGLLDTGVRLSHSQVAVLGAQAASGLAYAHRRGIVHRDIKPSNLLFDDEGHLRIADFGVARALAESALTEPLGAIFGTVRYASPEQAEGRPLDDRTDVYSLALVLYECLTGRVPFTGDTITAMLMARVGATLPPAVELGPLAPILAQAAISEPLARLDSAAIYSDLELLARELPPAKPLPLARASAAAGPVNWSDRDPTNVDGVSLAAAEAASEAAAAEAAAAALLPADAVKAPEAPGSVAAPGSSAAPDASGAPDVAADDITLVGLAHDAGTPGVAAAALVGVADPDLAAVAPRSLVSDDPTAPHPAPARWGGADRREPVVVGPESDLGVDAGAGTGSPPRLDKEPRRTHRRLRWVMLVLAIVLLAAAAATGLVLSNHNQKKSADLLDHVVPSFRSMTLAGAESAARRAGLEAKETSSAWDANVAAGIVIGQSIPRGQHERIHTVIGLELSKGTEPVAVPSLLKDSFVTAERALTAAHLGHQLSYVYSTTYPKGSVITWSHMNGMVPPATTIVITISKGRAPLLIPHVPLSDDWAQASKVLMAAGFVPQKLMAFSSKIQGSIVSVLPNYSDGLEPYGTTVQVTFSKGPQYFQIPNKIIGEPVSLARRQLENLGFVVKVLGSGFVFASDPGAGDYEAQGSTVHLAAI